MSTESQQPGTSPVLVECAEILNKHLLHKRSPSFLGALGKREKGFTMMGFSPVAIPLHVDKFPRDRENPEKGPKERYSVDVCVVDAVKEGFCKVPIEAQGNKGGPKPVENAKPLSEMMPWPRNKALSYIRCWPYKTVPNFPQEKDERCEDLASEVYPGMVLRLSLWSDKARGSKKPSDMGKGLQTTFDGDEIPAFTPFVFEVDCKGWSETVTVKGKTIESATTKGYGISISRINPIPDASLYSIMHKLPLALRSTVAESVHDNNQWHEQFPSIKNVIATQGGIFYVGEVHAQATAYTDDRQELVNAGLPAQIRLNNWVLSSSSSTATTGGTSRGGGGGGGGAAVVAESQPEHMHPIDILAEHAMAATNTCTIEAACSVIELAANAKALRLVVCHNEYRPGRDGLRSPVSGWPLIDTEILLQSIKTPVSAQDLVLDATGHYVVFKPTFEVAFPCMASAGSDADNDEDTNEESSVGAGGGGDEVERLCPLLYVSTTILSPVDGSSGVKTPDFLLCGPDVDLGKALFVRFVHPKFPQECVVMSAYINLSRPQITMPGLGINILAGAQGAAASALSAGKKRQRWMQQAASIDPFAGKISATVQQAAAGGGGGGASSASDKSAAISPPAAEASSNKKDSSEGKKKQKGSK